MIDKIFEQIKTEKVPTIGSSAISKAEYNPTTGDMNIKFHKGTLTYVYPNLSEQEAEDFRRAVSKGKAFHNIIKPHSSNH